MEKRKNWSNPPTYAGSGRDKIYPSPDALAEVAVEYFEYVEENPLIEQKVFSTGTRATVNKMRAMSIMGFCLFAGISPGTFQNYRKNKEYEEVCDWIANVIHTQKFEGAAADLLNSTIISRDLQLAERTEITGRDGAPLESASDILMRKLDEIAKRD